MPRVPAFSLIAAPLVLLAAACTTAPGPSADHALPTSRTPVPGSSAAVTGAPGARPQTTAPPAVTEQEDAVKIELSVGDQRFTATLAGSAAARDLLTQLPLSLDMTDHGAVEKTGPLPSPLSLDGQPAGADPGVGDIGYYAPGNDLVLYYGDQSYYPGIVILGRMDGDAAERIAQIDGSVTVTVDASDG